MHGQLPRKAWLLLKGDLLLLLLLLLLLWLTESTLFWVEETMEARLLVIIANASSSL
jgi:hypothetical protein